MEKPEALEKIIAMMNDVCVMPENYNSNITLETKTSDIIDSLDVIELAMAIENDTEGKISDYTMENWNTIGDIVQTFINLSENE